MNKKIILLVVGLIVVVAVGPIAALAAAPTCDYSQIIAAIDRLTTTVNKVDAMQGPQGETGPMGPTGPTGPKGADGVTVHFGEWQKIVIDESSGVYWSGAVETDGFVTFFCAAKSDTYVRGFAGGTEKVGSSAPVSSSSLVARASITMPVRKGDTWQVYWDHCDVYAQLTWLPLSA